MASQKKSKQAGRKSNAKSAEVFLSIDVECVATGCGHLDRTPVSIAIYNEAEDQLFFELIRPEIAVHNYLTPLTGFEAHQFQHARTFAEVMADVRSHLGPKVVLVGQGIENDIRWLELKAGSDYHRFIDLAAVFTTEIKNFGQTKQVVFGLQHVAKICLTGYVPTEVHSAATDALISMQLFKLFGGRSANQKALKAMHHKLRQGGRPERSYLAINNYALGDVCCAAYSTAPCRCGQPNIKTIFAAAPGQFPYPFPVVAPVSAHVPAPAPAPPSAPSAPALKANTGAIRQQASQPQVAAAAPQPVAPPAPPAPSACSTTLIDEYPTSYRTIWETQMRGGGLFNPHDNYDDDYDNLYGDFYGNSGGSDRN